MMLVLVLPIKSDALSLSVRSMNKKKVQFAEFLPPEEPKPGMLSRAVGYFTGGSKKKEEGPLKEIVNTGMMASLPSETLDLPEVPTDPPLPVPPSTPPSQREGKKSKCSSLSLCG